MPVDESGDHGADRACSEREVETCLTNLSSASISNASRDGRNPVFSDAPSIVRPSRKKSSTDECEKRMKQSKLVPAYSSKKSSITPEQGKEESSVQDLSGSKNESSRFFGESHQNLHNHVTTAKVGSSGVLNQSSPKRKSRRDVEKLQVELSPSSPKRKIHRDVESSPSSPKRKSHRDVEKLQVESSPSPKRKSHRDVAKLHVESSPSSPRRKSQMDAENLQGESPRILSELPQNRKIPSDLKKSKRESSRTISNESSQNRKIRNVEKKSAETSQTLKGSRTLIESPLPQGIDSDIEKQDPSQETKYQRFSRRWSEFVIRTYHKPLIHGLHYLTDRSARNPWTTIGIISFISMLLLGIGFSTNFRMVTDENILYTPTKSYASHSYDYIQHRSNFPPDPRYLVLIFHNNGKNVLSKEQARLVFNATDTIMNMPSYNDVCSDGNVNFTLPNGTALTTCYIGGIMRFWNFSSLLFDFITATDEQAIAAMSAITYPDGAPVDNSIFGNPKRNRTSNLLVSATSYTVFFALPNTVKEAQHELEYLQAVLDLNEKWQSNNKTANLLTVTAAAPKAFGEEFTRAIYHDLPLVPVVFITMSIFSCLYFFRRNRIQSRCFLGFASVVSVLLSIMSGYGLLFTIGVPFTTMTQLIPFVIFGVGLDDAFMITDTYERTDPSKTPEQRIFDAIEECGFSITLTTMTSTLSFGIGISSSVPAIKWLCLYACPTIVIVLIWQLTFYVACVVLDERRIQQRRLDICLCLRINDYQVYAKQMYDYNKNVTEQNDFSHRIMKAYSDVILNPKMRVFIIINFIVLLGLCAWSTTKLSQRFQIEDVLPSDSYLKDFIDASANYVGEPTVNAKVYFRNVDFSSKYVQEQMETYVNDLAGIRFISQQPDHFWLRDFKAFQKANDLSNYTFNDQLQIFLRDPRYHYTYFQDMAFSSNGTLLESRCQIVMRDCYDNIKLQISALQEQQAVTLAQPINHGKDEMPFFTFAIDFNAWSFYSICVQQLRRSTLSGIGSVTLLSLLIIPHWTAAVIICPVICMMYIDILGIMHWAGLFINVVSYVTVVMSIGLIVDYLLHILLRYYETTCSTRRDRTTQTLCTVGVSVFAGGFSTFLGTMPLVFSTSQIFWTAFIAFLTIVSVALAHGLIFLPVVLASIGPLDNIPRKHTDGQLSPQATSIVNVSEISCNGRIERRMSM